MFIFIGVSIIMILDLSSVKEGRLCGNVSHVKGRSQKNGRNSSLPHNRLGIYDINFSGSSSSIRISGSSSLIASSIRSSGSSTF